MVDFLVLAGVFLVIAILFDLEPLGNMILRLFGVG